MKGTAFLLFACFVTAGAGAQSSSDAAVLVTATAQANQIDLSWTGNATTSQYYVYRKQKTAIGWGSPLATLAGTVTQFSDNSTSPQTNYEYMVRRQGTNYTGYGYVNAGFEIPEIEYRGRLILIVDSSYSDSLSPEISRLVYDIEGDGWEVIRHDVRRDASVPHVKSLIVNDCNIMTDVTAVLLFGHVPVPYSGNLNPDGHPDHLGAWPADVYYGDVNGTWTDVSITSTTASPPRTQNVPGDGKFDQSVVPGDVELQVGRIDLASMGIFGLTEKQLLKNYLDKDHGYRKKLFTVQKRAVIDDNFGYFSGEAFAASGYKNFSSLVGTGNITAADYFTTMGSGDYLWSYGCGGGSYTSAGGIGSTSDFTLSSLQGVFTMLFGSYFGDWDVTSNFLRAPLAQGKILTCVWSGRPHYQFHHMTMGENIGYGLLITQNNPGNAYFASPVGISGKWVHNALMGDPTLRNDVVAPVSNVVATKTGYDCVISWNASTESGLAGYNIYMKNDSARSFQRLNGLPVAGTTYTDYCLQHQGVYTYMVRAVKLEQTPGGSYFNLSEGISDTAYNTVPFDLIALFSTAGGPVEFTFAPVTSLATSHDWDFGDAQGSVSVTPVHTYSANGNFTVRHIAYHACATDTSWQQVNVTEVGITSVDGDIMTLFPNPAHRNVTIVSPQASRVRMVSLLGSTIREFTSKGEDRIDLDGIPAGVYMLECKCGKTAAVYKLVVE